MTQVTSKDSVLGRYEEREVVYHWSTPKPIKTRRTFREWLLQGVAKLTDISSLRVLILQQNNDEHFESLKREIVQLRTAIEAIGAGVTALVLSQAKKPGKKKRRK